MPKRPPPVDAAAARPGSTAHTVNLTSLANTFTEPYTTRRKGILGQRHVACRHR
ncbi:MAG: hypothetical protein WKF54_03915 [Nocardioidaceae bacterium]